jgi:3-methyladenine DNA glycosylase AlkC
MADLLKDMFNPQSVGKLAAGVLAAYPAFELKKFTAATINDTWDGLELSGRGRRVAENLGEFLPADFPQAISILDKVAPNHDGEFMGTVFPEYVMFFGTADEHWDIAVAALARYTVYCSSEFAVRPFIKRDEPRMMAQMLKWAHDENEHIRRLASEGCRPALPWAPALPAFKADPAPVLPILETLKADPSDYVRRSVANNLNDISKTHPELVAEIAEKWYGENPDTDWVVKHACRTLLKKANRRVLAIFGFNEAAIELGDIVPTTASLSIGESMAFSFDISVSEPTKIRLEYAVDFVKANSKRSRKIFQISEIQMKAGEKKSYTRKHSFADLSTRRHYPGPHTITLIINGTERGGFDLELE